MTQPNPEPEEEPTTAWDFVEQRTADERQHLLTEAILYQAGADDVDALVKPEGDR